MRLSHSIIILIRLIPAVHLFLPEYASQLGNINQWNIFLGQLIYDFSAEFLLAKYELSPEEAINKAWHVVCDDTSDYANIGTDIPESTGRKVVDGFM